MSIIPAVTLPVVLLAVLAALAREAPQLAAERIAPQPTIEMKPCRVALIAIEVRCGSYIVFEDRTARAGRRITLDIVILPSRKQPAAADPVFFLAGGPGMSASAIANRGVSGALRDERDVVFIDARGTSKQTLLTCPSQGDDKNVQSYLQPILSAARMRQCRVLLEPIADLRSYGNGDIVEDLEEGRRGLGYGKINLWGGSAGSRTAMAYVNRYPDAIRSVVLSGVSPPIIRHPLHHSQSAQLSFDRLVAACEADAFCGKEYSGLQEKWTRVLARLDSAPVIVEVPHPVTVLPWVKITLGRDFVTEAIRGLLYSSANARFIPAIVDEAAKGNWQPAARRTLERYRTLNETSNSTIHLGAFVSQSCDEDTRRIRDQDVAPVNSKTFIGDVRVREQIAACGEWPTGSPPEWVTRMPNSAVPALLLSGYYDPITPPNWADSVAMGMPNSKHVIIAAGHGAPGPCTDDLIRRFLSAGSASGLDVSCAGGVKLPPFARRDE